jgi:hypothetical protein
VSGPVNATVLDGVFSRADPESPAVFHAPPEPSADDIAAILLTVRVRILRLLERRGLVRGGHAGDVPDPWREEAPLLAACYGASVQGSVALGPRAGHFVSRVRSDSPPAPSVATTRGARLDGYSVHADVRIPAHDRQRLEHLCRYIARPWLSTDCTHCPMGASSTSSAAPGPTERHPSSS